MLGGITMTKVVSSHTRHSIENWLVLKKLVSNNKNSSRLGFKEIFSNQKVRRFHAKARQERLVPRNLNTSKTHEIVKAKYLKPPIANKLKQTSKGTPTSFELSFKRTSECCKNTRNSSNCKKIQGVLANTKKLQQCGRV